MQKAITITFSLPPEMKPELDDVTQKEGISSGELITKAIKEYLFFRQYRLLRDKMILKAQAQGIYTDQDVFDRVS